jgi:hypothetical protein
MFENATGSHGYGGLCARDGTIDADQGPRDAKMRRSKAVS